MSVLVSNAVSRILVLLCRQQLMIARYAFDLSKSTFAGRTKQ